MNRSVWTMAMAFCLSSAIAQQKGSKGIIFFNGNWTALMETARQEKKMIFVDVYTDWCGPCKVMDKFIFPQEEVGNKYNASFINYKFNAEKGEGNELARRFNISAYPTFLYLNSEGQLVHKVIGEKNVAEFTGLADIVLQKGGQNSLGALEAAYKKGERGPAFLQQYVRQLTQLDVDNTQPLDDYVKGTSMDTLQQEPTLLFIGQNLFGTQSEAFIFLMNNYAKLSTSAREQLQERLYRQIVERSIPPAIAQKRYAEYQQLVRYLSQLNPLTEKQQIYVNRLKMYYADRVKDYAELKAVSNQWISRLQKISDDSIHREDDREYNKFMAPFLAGKEDSTRHSDWQEGKADMKIAYSKGIAFQYYYAASLYVNLPDADTSSLRQALSWAERAQLLDPTVKVYAGLVAALSKKLKLPYPEEK
ncbi:MAG: thioredoxin family protein [Bacteroidetes bacterium]|nr:thioredoxin family protein [Bacteroidota bacterium]